MIVFSLRAVCKRSWKKAWRLITFSTFIEGISSSTDFMFLYVSVSSLSWVICLRSCRQQKVAWYLVCSRTHKNTYDASLSAAIQMSCVALCCHVTMSAAARHLQPLWQPGLTSAASPLHLPHLPPLPHTIRGSSPQPRHPRHHHPQHPRLPLPAPGTMPACQPPPQSTGRVWTAENVAQTRRQLTTRLTAALPNCLPISFRC